jgi:glycosyltransferase involved in cell wall biosynthesis
LRLHEHLCAAGVESSILDLSTSPKEAPGVVRMDWPSAVAHLSSAPRSIVHFHNFEPGNAAAYERLSRRHVTVLSLHNERFADELRELGLLRRHRALGRLRKLHCVVVDSEHCRALADELWGEACELRVIPEFIPPRTVPPLAHPALIELRARSSFLIATNAWRVCFHRGEDRYGLDLLIEMMVRLVDEHGLDVGLACLLPGRGEEAYLDQLLDRAAASGVRERVHIVRDPIEEASSLWREADVVVRATNTDGNSLTVLEALALGVPVVASDCVARPAGTTTFRSRDTSDLTECVARVLKDLPSYRASAAATAPAGSGSEFVELYDTLKRRWIAA